MEMERRLAEIGRDLDFPVTPTLTGRVGAELRGMSPTVEAGTGEDPARRDPDSSVRSRSSVRGRSIGEPRAVPRLRLLLLVVLAALLLAAGAIAAVPSARHAVLEFLGLRGETIERVPSLPENVRAKPGWHLGSPTTLAAARHGLIFDPLVPRGLEDPNGVFLDSSVLGGALNLTYPPQPGLPRSRLTGVGLLIDQLSGQAAPGFYGKMVPRGARFERFRFRGQFAAWVEGLHVFTYKPSTDHTFHLDHARLAANALIVQRGDVMIRLEARFDKPTALAIARSLHP
ncbi:MAG: hypothetical protein BGO11_05765 [Solirubrobacterales bacterium 70-9]|nr:MAG: hypothetical protein BGO11_05765 [Solirubrobacterales bacterium 70-9]